MFSNPTLYLFLLLPVAALSGWLIGRRERQKQVPHLGAEIPLGYIRGLNYLLNEQPDKAIDVFIQLLDVNSDTVETHPDTGCRRRRRKAVGDVGHR